MSNFVPIDQGFVHGDFVGVFQIAADGQAHGDARDAKAKRFQ